MSSFFEEWENYAATKGNEFVCISKLPQYIGKIAPNVFGIVTAIKEPTKSKGGEGDWSMTITISDPTCPPPSRGFMILLFKQRREECPSIKVGDIVKCSVKCQGYQGRAQGMISKFNQRGKLYLQVLISGDPNLALSDSQIYSNLMKWWRSLSVNNSSKIIIDRLLKAPTAAKKKRPELTFYDIGSEGKEKVYFDTYCKVVKTIPDKPDSSTQMLIITDYSSNRAESSYDYPLCLESGSIEEFPPNIDPEYLVVLTLWDNHAHAFEIVEGSYLYLQNVQSKIDSSGRYEYAIHGDPVYPTKRLVHFVTRFDAELAPLLNRERKFMEGTCGSQPILATQLALEIIPTTVSTTTFSNSEASNIEKELIPLKDIVDHEIKVPAPTEIVKDVSPVLLEAPYGPNEDVADSLSEAERDDVDHHLLMVPSNEILDSPLSTNTNVAINKRKFNEEYDSEHQAKPEKKIKTISEIIDLPWPGKYRVKAKVVDYLPRSMNQFVHAICPDCSNCFWQTCQESKCDCGSLLSPSTYVYMISLLLYDGVSYLPVLLCGEDAERILGCPATPAFQNASSENIKRCLSEFLEFEQDPSLGLKVVEKPHCSFMCSLITYTNNDDPSQVRVKLVDL